MPEIKENSRYFGRMIILQKPTLPL